MVCVGIYNILGVIIICKHQGMTMKLVFITHLLLFPSTFIRLGIFFFFFLPPSYVMKTETHMIGRESRETRLKEVKRFPQGPKASWGQFSLLLKILCA